MDSIILSITKNVNSLHRGHVTTVVYLGITNTSCNWNWSHAANGLVPNPKIPNPNPISLTLIQPINLIKAQYNSLKSEVFLPFIKLILMSLL